VLRFTRASIRRIVIQLTFDPFSIHFQQSASRLAAACGTNQSIEKEQRIESERGYVGDAVHNSIPTSLSRTVALRVGNSAMRVHFSKALSTADAADGIEDARVMRAGDSLESSDA